MGLCKTCYGTFKGRTKRVQRKGEDRDRSERYTCGKMVPATAETSIQKRSVCQQLEARSQVLGHMSLDASMRRDGNARSLCAS